MQPHLFAKQSPEFPGLRKKEEDESKNKGRKESFLEKEGGNRIKQTTS
jgi:hypothetical protein